MSQLNLKTAALRRCLDTVRPALDRKVTIPILSTVKIESRDGALSMLATNLDHSIRVQTQESYTGGGMAVVGERLMTWVKLQDADEVKLAEQANGRVTLSCGRGRAQVPTMELASFPQVSMPAETHSLTMRQGELLRGLKLVAFAISQEESRYTLNGALLEVSCNELRIVATDGYRLSLYRVPVVGSPTQSIMLPAGLCKILLGMLDDTDETVRLWWDETNIGVSITRENVGIVEMTHRRMTGQFPNYRAVVPLESDRVRFTVSAAHLLRAIQRSSAFADNKSGAIVMTFTADGVKVHSSDAEAGEADDSVEVATGVDNTIVMTLKGEYITEALAKINGEVTIGVINASSSLLVTAVPSEDTALTYIVMPINKP